MSRTPASNTAPPQAEAAGASTTTADALRANAPLPEAVALDLSGEVAPPDYVLDGVIERDALTLLTGRRGSAKSLFGQGFAAAVAQRHGIYLDREIRAERVLIVDEENPRIIPHSRLHALGVTTDEHRARIRYFNKQGVRLGEEKWNRWLSAQLEDFRPDLLVIDGLMAATTAKVKEGEAATELFKLLKRFASAYGIAVLIYHHERKRQKDEAYDPGEATLGSVMYGNLADIHLSLEAVKDGKTEEVHEDGKRRLRTEVTLSVLRLRDDIEPEPERVAVTSTKDGKRLLTMAIASEGTATPAEPQYVIHAAQIGRALHAAGHEMRTGQLKRESRIESDGAFARAANHATAQGWVARPLKEDRTEKHGSWAPGPNPPPAEDSDEALPAI